MCCWFHKKSADIYKNATTDSGKNVPELLINEQYVQQNGEQTQTTELIIKTNPIPTSRMSYVNKENSVVNIHTETTDNCVDMSSNYVGRSLALDTAHQVPLVNTMNNDQITIKSQTNTAHFCTVGHSSEIVNLLACPRKASHVITDKESKCGMHYLSVNVD